MSVWDKISQFFTGGNLVKDIVDGVDRFVTTKEDKAHLENAAMKIAHQHELAIRALALEADKEFNDRIKDLEGTSKDLLQAGWIGRFILFLRGAQRPLWGYGTIYFVWQYYSGQIEHTQENYMLTLSLILLVGGFLFGERAIKNVAPFITRMLEAKKKS